MVENENHQMLCASLSQQLTFQETATRTFQNDLQSKNVTIQSLVQEIERLKTSLTRLENEKGSQLQSHKIEISRMEDRFDHEKKTLIERYETEDRQRLGERFLSIS